MSFDQLLQNTKFSKDPDYYAILGCDRSSSNEQITCEYRTKVRNLHPDKVQNANSSNEFTTFQGAYSVLSDPQRRKLYDIWLGCPLPMQFDEFERNNESIRQSMHWVTPKSTPMISAPLYPKEEKQASRWKDGRYESDAAKRFRNYQI